MAEPSAGWWKLTFLRRKKSQPKVLYEIPAESVSNAATGQHGSGTATVGATAHPEGTVHDSQLDARLERIVDKTTACKGRHVKVSHSGRFKEKKKVRATLAENPDMFPAVIGLHTTSNRWLNITLSLCHVLLCFWVKLM